MPILRPRLTAGFALQALRTLLSTLSKAVLVLASSVLLLPAATATGQGATGGKVFVYADKALALAQIRWAGEACPGIRIDEAALQSYRDQAPAMPLDADPDVAGYIWGASQTWQQVVFLSNPEFWCGRLRLIGEMQPDVNSGLAILYESALALNRVLIFDPLEAD